MKVIRFFSNSIASPYSNLIWPSLTGLSYCVVISFDPTQAQHRAQSDIAGEEDFYKARVGGGRDFSWNGGVERLKTSGDTQRKRI